MTNFIFTTVAVAALSLKFKLGYRVNAFLTIFVAPPVTDQTKKTTRLLLGQGRRASVKNRSSSGVRQQHRIQHQRLRDYNRIPMLMQFIGGTHDWLFKVNMHACNAFLKPHVSFNQVAPPSLYSHLRQRTPPMTLQNSPPENYSLTTRM